MSTPQEDMKQSLQKQKAAVSKALEELKERLVEKWKEPRTPERDTEIAEMEIAVADLEAEKKTIEDGLKQYQ